MWERRPFRDTIPGMPQSTDDEEEEEAEVKIVIDEEEDLDGDESHL